MEVLIEEGLSLGRMPLSFYYLRRSRFCGTVTCWGALCPFVWSIRPVFLFRCHQITRRWDPSSADAKLLPSFREPCSVCPEVVMHGERHFIGRFFIGSSTQVCLCLAANRSNTSCQHAHYISSIRGDAQSGKGLSVLLRNGVSCKLAQPRSLYIGDQGVGVEVDVDIGAL